MSFSVQEVLSWVQGRVVNSEESQGFLESIRVNRPSPLLGSKRTDLSYFFNREFQVELAAAQPGILITGEPFVEPLRASGLSVWKDSVVIACRDPYRVMAILSEKFAEKSSTVAHVLRREESQEQPQVHPSAVVSDTAELGPGVRVGAHCVIEDGVRVGQNTIIYPGCYLGPGVRVGRDTVLFPQVTVYEQTQIGDRVRIHAGSRLGSDGFGYAPVRSSSESHSEVVAHQKIYHLGRAVIEDDVEIGANSCVDRGTLGDTRVGRGSKLDNLVHVGHNAQVDEGVIICGGSCLAGNAKIGKFVTLGGLTGVTNHVWVKDRASVGALSLITKDVEPGETAVGNPQRSYQDHFKAHAKLNRLLAERRTQK